MNYRHIFLAPLILLLLLSNPIIANDQCSKSSLPEGITKIKIEHEDSLREYRVFIPKDHSNFLPLPVVLNYHGTGSNADQQAAYSDLDRIAEERKFIHVNPQGKNLNGRQVFNCLLYTSPSPRD